MWRRLRRKTPKDAGHSNSSLPPGDHPDESPRSRTLSVASITPQDAARDRSPFSNFRGPSPGPEHRTADALGLHVVYQPSFEAPVDIIFVHGLGGASRKTWSKSQDPRLFWPEQWLPFEPEICQARILTFGYNASFRYGSPNSIANIADFAKDLLFGMKFGKDNDTEDLRVGRVPIIFVVHSMGGLVVKKAYLLGQNDENYQEILKSVSAIMFLATPHRGTSLADLLNKILSVSFQSPKNYITDLDRSSSAPEDLNEQFRHAAPKLSIMSFYETLQTSIGPKSLMVLDKDSSILGYPGEISKPLNADHHDVCKFADQDDSNYVSVRNAMKTLVEQLKTKGINESGTRESDEIAEIEKILGFAQNPEDDLTFFEQRRMPGTCKWVLLESGFRLWLEMTLEPCITWLNAPPASGKSTLAAYIIEHVQGLNRDCQYFYFRFGDQTKRSTSVLLRSIGVQLTKHNPAFRRSLVKLSCEGVRLSKADARTMWQKLFVSLLSQIGLIRPLYWVIDALDESDSPKSFLDLLQSLSKARIPIRILIISRNTESLSSAFERLSASIPVSVIEKLGQNHIWADIELYVQQEMRYTRGSDELKRQIMEKVLHSANGNFLWVHLVLEEIHSCHTQQAIRQTLEEIPPGMEALYQRMELAVAKRPKQADRNLARALISWTICAQRPLSVEELSQALRPDFPEFLDLKRTIRDVCGNFIVVDQTSYVVIVHQSARDYLTKTRGLQLSIDLKASHRDLFVKTISFLSDSSMQSKIGRDSRATQKMEPFLAYAATSWPYHLRQASSGSGDSLTLLVDFLEGRSVIFWIHTLALFRHLEVLVRAARTLTFFLGLNQKLNADKSPLLHRLQDLDLLDSWATDFLKIVGKFGRHLLQDPTSIYKLVPPFCPSDSNLQRQFRQDGTPKLAVSGIANTIWDDCLAKVMLPKGAKAWKIACAGRYFAVLSSAGSIFLGDSFNFEEFCTLTHGEYITAMSFNTRCDTLVSCGVKNTKIWAIPDGRILGSSPNSPDVKVMDVTFAENDSKIITASDDKTLRYLQVSNIERGWKCLNPTLLKEITQVEGGFITSPSYMAFSPDVMQIAVAYRGYPLSVWSTTEPRLIGRCKRVSEHRPDHGRPSVSWMAVDRVSWNPVTGHIVGLYKDGSIFKWHPVGDDSQEAHTTADEIEVSPDGKLFVTSDSNGTVKVWNFTYFSVIYQLSSENLVSGLTFGPDCTRFYDLRGSSINVWEPNSLVRLSEAEEITSETASDSQTFASATPPSEAYVESVEPICALAAARKTSVYCVASEDGVVNLFHCSSRTSSEVMRSPNFLAVSHMIWGEDEKHIALADLGGNITVKRVRSSQSKAVEKSSPIQSIFSARAKADFGGIRQILLDKSSTRIFIQGQELIQTWSLGSGRIESTSTIKDGIHRTWINHPSEKDLIIGVSPLDLTILRWESLLEVCSLKLDEIASRLLGRSSLDVEESHDSSLARLAPTSGHRYHSDSIISKAMLTQDTKHFLFQISELSAQGRRAKDVVILTTSSLDNMELESLYVPLTLVTNIEIPLGILSGGRLVFLDKDLWLCTFNLYSGDMIEPKRHFFIPMDWASTEGLEQCCLLDDGTLLLPKGGEVAVITSDLASPEW